MAGNNIGRNSENESENAPANTLFIPGHLLEGSTCNERYCIKQYVAVSGQCNETCTERTERRQKD